MSDGYNFQPGIGRLATDVYEFLDHTDGYSNRHNSSDIDVEPPVVVNSVPYTTVSAALAAIVGEVAGNFIASQDLSGNASAQTVIGIQTIPVSNIAPSTGETFIYTGGKWTPSPVTSGPPAGAAGGNLGGTYPNPTVISLNGIFLPGGSPTTGNVLQASSSSSLAYGALNLAGGANYVTGALPSGNQVSQTMGGDVTGTTAATTVIRSSATLFSTNNMQNDGYVNVTDNTFPVSIDLPLFSGGTTQCSYVSSINHQSSPNIPIGSYDTALRIDMKNTGGGSWDVDETITGSSCQWLTHIAGNQGTHELITGNMVGLGIGDCIPFSMIVDSWGGGTTLDDGPSVSESSNVGEFDWAEGGARYASFNAGPVPVESLVHGGCIFTGTVTGSPSTGATTINYTTTANQDIMGCRFILNLNHTKTNGVCTAIAPNQSTQETVFTFSVSDFTSADVGRYIKIGSTSENYTVTAMSQLEGDDVFLNGKGVGHWFPIKSVTTNTVTTYGVWDIVDYTVGVMQLPSAPYMVVDGTVIQSFTTSSIVIQANSYTWSNGDVLYSPPNHYQGPVGINMIMQKLFKTGPYSLNSDDAIKVVSRGLEPIYYGLHLTGVGIDGYGGFKTGIQMDNWAGDYGINMLGASFDEAAILVSQDAPIVMDSSTLFPQIVGLGNEGIQIAGKPTEASLFATDNLHSSLVINHPNSGQIQINDADADVWLIQQAETYLKLGPGAGSGHQSLTIDTNKARLIRGTQFNITTADGYYEIQTTDYYIAVQTLSAPITIVLPSSSVSVPGDTYVIKDAAGSASAHNISIDGNGIQIDGSGSDFVMNTNYQSLKVAYDNTSNNWMII